MKRFAIILAVACTSILCIDIYINIKGSYRYENSIGSYWSLAEKASTIEKKIEGIDQFVAALEGSGLAGSYNAIKLNTPDNSFDENMRALKSLQLRLHEIAGMDITSFQYQTAIQQITQQEQGEAKNMLNVFEGCWWKKHYIIVWNWVGWTQVITFSVLLFLSLIILFSIAINK